MLRVLIVEDEPLIAMHLEDILLEAGHQVVGIATQMAAALDVAATSPDIDLAIMDIDLSAKPDGVEAAALLRSKHGIGSLFVSAHLTDANVQRAASLQPLGFIGKPFVDEQITQALSSLDAELRPVRSDTVSQLVRASDLGRLTGRDSNGHAGSSPWSQDGRRDLRRAWLTGFAEGRAFLRTVEGKPL